MNRIRKIVRHPFFSDYRTLAGLWLLMSVIAWLAKMRADRHNNFLIFKYQFWHTLHQQPLYLEYPQEYFDHTHYGPFFGALIAPFALLPEGLGLLLWLVALSGFLYAAVRTLPLEKTAHVFIVWFCAHELLTALFMQQFNIAIAAIIILTFVCIEKEKDIWATFFIMLGTFVKLYGVVGLAFFFFSRHKAKFIVSCAVWAVIFFLALMAISSPEYIIEQYIAWFERLQLKNSDNLFALSQNVSFLGLIRKISGNISYSDLWPILGGIILFVLPYLRLKQYAYPAFRMMWLASVLMFVVLFSTGSESSTYIIPFTGISIWFMAVPWKRTHWDIVLLVFAFVLSSLSPSDIFPRWIREDWIKPYALKALPVTIIWFKLVYEMCRRDYAPSKNQP